jgi:hypothetical protein
MRRLGAGAALSTSHHAYTHDEEVNMKPNKQAAVDRKKKINQQNADRTSRPAKGQDSNKVHNTKGKNYHSRSF